MSARFSSHNLSGLPVPANFVSRAKKILNKLEKYNKKKWGEVNLVFVTPKKIKDLNSVYHRRNKVTDVLSFTYKSKPAIDGEIIICVTQAKSQAKFFKHSLIDELEFLFIHGGLHLQGFDHVKPKDRQQMEKLEELFFYS